MTQFPAVQNNPVAPGKHEKIYHCGTLTYTRITLVMVFAWLLWGDFCLVLMEAVVPSVLPLKLKSLGCSNWMMGAILSTIPGILSMTMCPYVSFKSDRYRSRWGRRIPFIIGTLPFLFISLLLLGWSDEIREFLQQHFQLLREYAPTTVTIGVIGFFMAMFQFFNMFVNSVFWYLFNDVVPAQFVGRFVGLLRIVSTLATTLYSYFIFRYAESHMREIFTGAAILYFIGFGLVCLMIKEGEYPPLEGEEDKDNKGIAGIKTYFREAFSHKFYWLTFAAAGFTTLAGGMNGFNVFFNKEMGLELKDIGTLMALSGVVAIVAMYCTSIFVDRWHPMRIYTYMSVFYVLGWSSGWVWLFVTLPGNYFFWIGLVGTFITMFQSALTTAAGFPRSMRIFPRSRFGQFCSAQSMLQSFCAIGSAMAAGLFLDIVRRFYNGSDFAYRFQFVWCTFFCGVSALINVYIYILWHRMGGDKHFHPPAPWSPQKVEEMPVTPTVGPQTRWLKISFRIFDALIGLSVLSIPCFMWWMYYHKGAMFACRWFGIAVLPLSVLAWVWWFWLKQSISNDMKQARDGGTLRNGIPHHGILIVVGTKYFLALGVWIAQIIITINLNMESGAVVFGIANVVTNFVILGIIQGICRVERGYSVSIDEAPLPSD